MADLDPQDPLPEASFAWRRTLVFGTSVAVAVFIWWQSPRLAPDAILTLIGWLLCVMVLDRLAYFGGASADDMLRLIATFRLQRGDKPKDPA